MDQSCIWGKILYVAAFIKFAGPPVSTMLLSMDSGIVSLP